MSTLPGHTPLYAGVPVFLSDESLYAVLDFLEDQLDRSFILIRAREEAGFLQEVSRVELRGGTVDTKGGVNRLTVTHDCGSFSVDFASVAPEGAPEAKINHPVVQRIGEILQFACRESGGLHFTSLVFV